MIAILRRGLLRGLLLAAPSLSNIRAFADDWDANLLRGVANLEHRHGGRLGVAVLDTAGTKSVVYRGDELFPLCSTFKFLAAAFVLARADRKQDSLAHRMIYTKDSLVPYSPVTEKYVGEPGLTLDAICAAAVTLSDNTAGNMMLDSFGGPAELTAYLRSLGDRITRLDRREPTLNEAAPGDPRDTTSPVAMAETMRKIIVGTALSASSQAQMTAWLVGCKTGDKRLRAGAPPGWRVGDKTGSGKNNATNDIAVFWPPARPPIIVTAYYEEARATDEQRSAVLSEVGRLAAA